MSRVKAKLTALQHDDLVPPCLCRPLAAAHGRDSSPKTIMKLANLSRAHVFRLSRMSSWEQVKRGVQCRFATACGIDLLRLAPELRYLRRVARTERGFRRLTPAQLKRAAEYFCKPHGQRP